MKQAPYFFLIIFFIFTFSFRVAEAQQKIRCGKNVNVCKVTNEVAKTVTLTATPDDGYSFAKWEWVGQPTKNPCTQEPPTSSTCTVPVDQNKPVRAVFNKIIVDLKVYTSANQPSKTLTVPYKTPIYLAWDSANAKKCDTASKDKKLNIDTTIWRKALSTAQFKRSAYGYFAETALKPASDIETLAEQSPSSVKLCGCDKDSLASDCPSGFVAGDIEAATCYEVTCLSTDLAWFGTTCGTFGTKYKARVFNKKPAGDATAPLTSSQIFSLTCSGSPGVTDTATVTVLDPTLTITKSVTKLDGTVTQTGGGTVSTSDGKINCGATCTASFAPESSVNLSVTPESSSYEFSGWGGNCSGTACSPKMNGDKSVIANFREIVPVSTTPGCSFSASPSTIIRGNSSLLSWSCANTSNCSVGQTQADQTFVGLIGSLSVSPLNTVTYYLSCSNIVPPKQTTVTVTTSSTEPPYADIKVNGSDTPITISVNDSANISWTSTNASSCSVTPTGWTGISSGPRSTGPLTSSQTYTLSCSGPGGSFQDSVSISVNAAGNDAPVSVAKISSDGVNYAKSISVTQGVPTAIRLSAVDSFDPDGWTNATNGVSSGGKCEWNRDLNRGVPTFELPSIANPASPAACNISLGTLTFNDNPGTYTYSVLRITDRQGLVSNIDTVSVIVEPPPVGGLSVSCLTPSPASQEINQPVFWSVNASGGTGAYAYSWSDNEGFIGSQQTVSKSYTTGGTKTATVTVTSGSENKSCSKSVNITQLYAFDLQKYGQGTVTCNGIGCSDTYPKGITVNLVASETDPQYQFKGWAGCTVNATDPKKCSVFMDDDQTLAVGFWPLLSVTKSGSGTVTSLPAGINCGASCSSNFSIGLPVSLTAIPAAGYRFSGWSGDSSSEEEIITLTMSMPMSVSATFVLIDANVKNLDITKFGGGDVLCGSSTCFRAYNEGTPLTLTAKPDSGNKFSSWDGDCAGTQTTCPLTMDADKSVIANFDPVGGDEDCSPPEACTGDDPNAAVTLNATETPGYKLIGWTGACVNLGAAPSCSVTLAEAQSTAPIFAPILTVSQSSGGVVKCNNASCEETYPYGTKITITAEPDANYQFGSWGGDCQNIGTTGANPTCILTMDAPHSFSAAFKPNNGNVKCEGSCVITPDTPPDAPVVLTAEPRVGYTISGWSGDCAGTIGNTCSTTSSGAQSATVIFNPVLNITKTGNGIIRSGQISINCGKGCARTSLNFPINTSFTVTAAPDPGFRFSGWGGACAGSGTAVTCTLKMDGPKNVIATFTQLRIQIKEVR